MNILQVTLGFYPAVAWGGPVKIVYENAQELIRRGHQVTVVCTNLLDKKHKIRTHTFEDEIDGIRVIYFNTWNIPQWPGTLGPIWLPDLKTRLGPEIEQYDVVHLNGYRNSMNLQMIALLKNHPLPLVIQPHGAMQIIVNSFFVKRVYDHLVGQQEIRRAQKFIALQETEHRQIMAYGVPPERIEIIPNGLNPAIIPDKLSPNRFRQVYDIPKDRRLVLFLGRINRKKGADMLVEAFARLRDDNIHLAIAGPDDGQLAEAQALVHKYQMEKRVTFTGALSGDEVWAAYQDADLFVLPCRTDTFPTTIMEACAMNTPMVITEGCEMAHLVQGKVADVTPFDVDAFSQAIEQLLSDAERYQRYQENCADLMQTVFSIQATINQIEQLYTKVIANMPKP